MKEEVYDIGGMHCSACSASVERVTQKLPGVVTSSVNLPLNRLNIAYDEKLCCSQDIIGKIEKAGFTAKLRDDGKKRGRAAETDTDDAKRHLKSARYSLIVSLCFAGVLLFVSMGHMIFPGMPIPDIISPDTHAVNFALLQLLLCVPVLFAGRRFFTGGFGALFRGNPNMDTLVAVSSSASFIYSVIMTFLITDDAGALHSLYYESAAVVVALVALGKYLEDASKEKTKSAIAKLASLTPDTSVICDGGTLREVPTDSVKVGDTLLIRPGARIPLDGTVTEGSGSVNEAMLTGESLPAEKTAGSEVVGGSVSVNGALYVRVTRVGEDTTLSGIIRFVEDAQGKKAPISRTADKVAGVFVPIVMTIALLSAVVWLIAGKDFSFALKIFTCVLVIACPCAMGLAAPTAIIVGTGLGAQHGILIRSGEALETAHKVTTAVFDKTGTVTMGVPKVTDIVSDDETRLLKTALSLEQLSDHPLSKAVCDHAAAFGITADAAENFENISGKGLSGTLGGSRVLVGSLAFMSENGIDSSRYSADITRLTGEGKTAAVVASGGVALGVAAMADTLKPDAAQAVASLRKLGIKTVLLTGDNRAAAAFIGVAAGFDEVEAEVLPTHKADVIKKYQSAGNIVMMVGDGINDAPALTQADVGCAVGSGSDIAVESSDIVLMGTSLSDVCRAIKLSRYTINNIKQNLFWAFCYNIIGIPIAAGVLYPAFHILLSPMIGALAMSLSSLFVVTNALRLRTKKL